MLIRYEYLYKCTYNGFLPLNFNILQFAQIFPTMPPIALLLLINDILNIRSLLINLFYIVLLFFFHYSDFLKEEMKIKMLVIDVMRSNE